MRGLKTLKLPLALILVLLVSACSITPIPFTNDEYLQQVEADREALGQDQEPVKSPVSLYEAIARSLKYNLDLRLEIAEKVLAERELDLSRYEQLPNFVANFGYTGRDNFSGATSQGILDGRQSLRPSTSSERDVFNHDLSLSWNILDFGVSYFRSKQAADRILIADEQRRKVVNDLIEDVRSVYWRAVAKDRLQARMLELLKSVSEAIKQSEEIQKSKIDKPLTALTYQRELVGIKRELEELQEDLSIAKVQLAALMNLKPGEDFELLIPERSNSVRSITLSPTMMEELALLNRSELHEVQYKKRINAQETKAAILQLLPGINLNFSQNYNSNTFLFNNDWLGYGANIGWNLVNILKYPSTKKAAKTRDLVLDAERLALSMAVITQVHLGIAQHQYNVKKYRTAAEYYDVQNRIMEQILAESATNSVSQQSVIREQMNTLVAELKYDLAYAEVENAYAGLYAAIGVDPVPDDAEYESVESLSRAIQQHFESLTEKEANFSMDMQSVSMQFQ